MPVNISTGDKSDSDEQGSDKEDEGRSGDGTPVALSYSDLSDNPGL